MTVYLSPEWLDAADRAVRAAPSLAEATAGVRLVIDQTVDGTDGDEVRYHVCIDDGDVRILPGPAPRADVSFRQPHRVAVAIASGTDSAQMAFMRGELTVGGDVRVLIEHKSLLDDLGGVLGELRSRTRFDESDRPPPTPPTPTTTEEGAVPELPEVQAHAERLDEAFGGATLSAFQALSFTALKTYDPPADAATGTALSAVTRRGKQLILTFGDQSHIVHLMQGGRLRPDDKQSPKPRGGLARWRFDDGRALLLTEAGREHKAGVWTVEGPPLAAETFADLGPDADQITLAELSEAAAANTKRLHGFLRDQRRLAGLGRRLANEVCHRARLSPFASTSGLDADALAALHRAIGEAISESLEFERARDDMSSSKERPGSVHHRTGEPCPVCGGEVRAVEYQAYTVNYCASCQTGGRILADNTTSRFLK